MIKVIIERKIPDKDGKDKYHVWVQFFHDMQQVDEEFDKMQDDNYSCEVIEV